MRIVFDLDGTLANASHREHFITGDSKDWNAFFEACDGDSPHLHVLQVFRALDEHALHQVEIWSGRGQGENGSVRAKTLDWLAMQGILAHGDPQHGYFPLGSPPTLRMRPHRDYTPDYELKKRWLNEATVLLRRPDLVFDDRQKVVDMWRAEGIPCFQVAPGDF